MNVPGTLAAMIEPGSRNMSAAMRTLLVAKVVSIALLFVGAFFPSVGGFEGKGMLFRLPLYLVPTLVVPVVWKLRGGRETYPVQLDLGLTVPFLLDTLGNLFGFFDRWDHFDAVLHFSNWLVLIWGITWFLGRRTTRDSLIVWIAATGIGAMAAIGWELAEFGTMHLGVGNLHLTYADTLADLSLGTTGGAIGAWIALRTAQRRS